MEWDPTQFLRESDDPVAPFALLVLHQPINERAFTVLNKHAYFTICADGGANRFFDMMQKHGRESIDLPNVIIGDLDSIRPSVRAHYEQLGVQVLKDADQYSTDFTKCLKYLSAHAAEIIADRGRTLSLPSVHDARLEILVMGGLGGRVDQAFSQIHHLYVMTRGAGEGAVGNLYLISEESITFVLQPGRHRIRTPRTNRPGVSGREDGGDGDGDGDGDGGGGGRGIMGKEAEQGFYLLEENVGIIPLSGPARITTHGFEWDVEDWLTEIGGQLSTSNHIRADVVSIETKVPVLFTLELAERFKRSR